VMRAFAKRWGWAALTLALSVYGLACTVSP